MAALSRFAPSALLFIAALTSEVCAQNRLNAEKPLADGIAKFANRDFEEATAHFEEALRADPNFAEAHYFLGLSFLQFALEAPNDELRQTRAERAAEALNRSSVIDPSLVFARLDAGVAEAILEQFDKAKTNFEEFVQSRPGDPTAYLYLAVLHYRRATSGPEGAPPNEEQLARASEYLDKAENSLRQGEPNQMAVAHIYFYRGLIADQRNDDAIAQREFEKVPEVAPGSQIAEDAEELLRSLDLRERAARPWSLSLDMGVDWDSNVILRGRNVPLPGDDGDSDWRFGLGSDFSYRVVDQEEWLVSLGVDTFNSWHADIDSFNVQNYGATASAIYSPRDVKWLDLGLSYHWDHTLLGNQTYLLRNRITPQVGIVEADWTRTTLYYQFDDRNYNEDYRDPRLNRDGYTNALGATQVFDLLEMYNQDLTLGLRYRYENVGTEGTEFASENQIFGFDLGVPLPENFEFNFTAEWERQHYDNPSLFDADRSRRRDLISTLMFALTKRFNENLSARFQIEVTEDDSNVRDRRGQEPFSYDRVIYGLTWHYEF